MPLSLPDFLQMILCPRPVIAGLTRQTRQTGQTGHPGGSEFLHVYQVAVVAVGGDELFVGA